VGIAYNVPYLQPIVAIESKPEDDIDISELVAQFVTVLPSYLGYLEKGSIVAHPQKIAYMSTLPTSCGQIISPLGSARLKLVECLAYLCQLNDDVLSEHIDELQIPSVLLKLMDNHYMNTMLHCKICCIFSEAIKSGIIYLIDTVCIR
jgi:hypothetical protein